MHSANASIAQIYTNFTTVFIYLQQSVWSLHTFHTFPVLICHSHHPDDHPGKEYDGKKTLMTYCVDFDLRFKLAYRSFLIWKAYYFVLAMPHQQKHK